MVCDAEKCGYCTMTTVGLLNGGWADSLGDNEIGYDHKEYLKCYTLIDVYALSLLCMLDKFCYAKIARIAMIMQHAMQYFAQ